MHVNPDAIVQQISIYESDIGRYDDEIVDLEKVMRELKRKRELGMDDGEEEKVAAEKPDGGKRQKVEETAEEAEARRRLKAEKRKEKRQKRRRKSEGDDDEAQGDFKIDATDDRFKALHEDHNFAIDPSNPQ